MKNKLPPVKGRLVYFAVIPLFAVLCTSEKLLICGGLILAAILHFHKQKKFSPAMLAMMAIIFFLFSASALQDRTASVTRMAGEETEFVIIFNNEIYMDGNKLSAMAEVYPAGEQVAVQYRIDSEQEKLLLRDTLQPGTACQSTGTLETPPPARNPNAFNYQIYLNGKDIYWILKLDSLDTGSCIGTKGDLLTPLKRFRQKQLFMIEKHFPKETAALSAALVFGDRSQFDRETERDYQKIGVVHLLAISGLHVGLLAGMLYFVFVRLGVTKEKAEELLLLSLPLYAAITGLAPPVMRAAAMLMLLIGAKRFQFKLSPLDAISIAFMAMIFFQPALIHETGFQLSFTVSFSLVLSARAILSSFKTFLGQTAAASFIAQLSSLPIILNEFHEISIISILANLFFIPVFSFLLLPLVLITYLFFSLAGGIPEIFLRLLEAMVHLVNQLSRFLADVPGASLSAGKPGLAVLGLLILAVPTVFIIWEKSLREKKNVPLSIFLFAVPLALQLAFPSIVPYGKVTFIDVGQGDSIFIQLPFNQGNYLIDTGGALVFEKEGWQNRVNDFDPGRDIVVPFLKAEGVRTIDMLILTHGDADHIGGAMAVLEEVYVKQIILPAATDRSSLELEIIQKALEKGTAVLAKGEGAGWKTRDGQFKFLGPPVSGGDRNDRSLILYAEFGGKAWLFTGDLGMEGEKRLLEKYPKLDVDVLKIGHHGSKNSSSQIFLQGVAPEQAIISVGSKNRYGHPGKEVLERLEGGGIRLYRTDEHGAIIYRFKGQSGTFHTQIP